jgi:imidazolonepropionase-like amidohydrolase
VVSGGRIAAIGKDARIPSGAQVIDGRGLRVYPGMIDADTTMGLTEIGSIDETSDTTDLGELKPQLRAYDAVHPESEHIPVTRVSGVTTALALPSGGIFCGHAALLNLDGWTVEEMAVRKSAGLVAVIPSPNTFAGFSLQTLSMLRRSLSEARREADVQAKRAVDLLDDARHYRQAREAREKDASLPPVRHDEKLEALQPVLRREVPVLARANSRAAIRAAVEFAQKQGLRLVIVGGASAGKMTPYLKEKDVGVIYGPVQRLPEAEDDPYDLPYATPGILARAGVRFAIATGDTSNSRNLAFDAGTALGSGLSETEAVRAVTLSPAELLGVADQLGSLEVGKLANLVVTIGDLLEIRSEVRHLFIRGRPIPLESRHTRLWDRYRARP